MSAVEVAVARTVTSHAATLVRWRVSKLAALVSATSAPTSTFSSALASSSRPFGPIMMTL